MRPTPIEKATRDELIGMVNDLSDALESLTSSLALKEGENAGLREALTKIAETRYSERDEPFDDALDIADKALTTPHPRSQSLLDVVREARRVVNFFPHASLDPLKQALSRLDNM